MGDGSSIKVWEDNWIPTNHTRRPLCRLAASTATRVQDLINFEEGSSNEAKIREEFIPPDADETLKILLGNIQEHRSAWAYENSGVFFVRSAYRLLSERGGPVHELILRGFDSGKRPRTDIVEGTETQCAVQGTRFLLEIDTWLCHGESSVT